MNELIIYDCYAHDDHHICFLGTSGKLLVLHEFPYLPIYQGGHKLWSALLLVFIIIAISIIPLSFPILESPPCTLIFDFFVKSLKQTRIPCVIGTKRYDYFWTQRALVYPPLGTREKLSMVKWLEINYFQNSNQGLYTTWRGGDCLESLWNTLLLFVSLRDSFCPMQQKTIPVDKYSKIGPKVLNTQNECLFHHFGGMLVWKSVIRFGFGHPKYQKWKKIDKMKRRKVETENTSRQKGEKTKVEKARQKVEKIKSQ